VWVDLLNSRTLTHFNKVVKSMFNRLLTTSSRCGSFLGEVIEDMTTFTTNTRFTIDLTGKLAFGNLPYDRLLDVLFQDGRTVGLLLEALLPVEFQLVSQNPDPNGAWDVAIGGDRYEVRVFNRRSKAVSFVKSSMKGAGRKYCPAKQLAKVGQLKGFIIIDCLNAPQLTVFGVPLSAVIGRKDPATMTRNDWSMARNQLYANAA
jgi:hypothetical protein